MPLPTRYVPSRSDKPQCAFFRSSGRLHYYWRTPISKRCAVCPMSKPSCYYPLLVLGGKESAVGDATKKVVGIVGDDPLTIPVWACC